MFVHGVGRHDDVDATLQQVVDVRGREPLGYVKIAAVAGRVPHQVGAQGIGQ